MTNSKKLIIFLVLAPPLLFGAAFLYVLYQGPRMTEQHHIREFQMIMPPVPSGTVTVAPPDTLPPAGQIATLTNPLQPTPTILSAGRVYYSYYCVFCHGESGAGDGPVGHSYVPPPADLRSARVAAYGDGQLLQAMLRGVGHEPVLERVVAPEHRWPLVLYVRTLPRAGKAMPRNLSEAAGQRSTKKVKSPVPAGWSALRRASLSPLRKGGDVAPAASLDGGHHPEADHRLMGASHL